GLALRGLALRGMERPSSRPLRVAWSLVETRRYEIAGTFPSGRAAASQVCFGPAARVRNAPRSRPAGRSRSVMVVNAFRALTQPRTVGVGAGADGRSRHKLGRPAEPRRVRATDG